MRIEFERSGGVTGMTTSGVVDTEQLEPQTAQEIRSLVDRADFFSLPSEVQTSGGGADQFRYVVTVEEEGRRRTVTLGDEGLSPELQTLMRRLTVLARGSR